MEIHIQGILLMEKLEGSGIYKWPDGTEYIGEYKNTIREGKGMFKWKNGVIFEGNFING